MVAVRRGDLVPVALQGDYGKPRPALVVQSSLFDEHPSVTILPVTSELRDAPLFRIRIEPSADNGLKKTSEIMVDKAHTVAGDKLGSAFGAVDEATLLAVNRALAVFLGIA